MFSDYWQAELELDRLQHRAHNEALARRYLVGVGLTGIGADAILFCARLDCPLTEDEVRDELHIAASAAVKYWKGR